MIEIKEVSQSEISQYLFALRSLINSNINLPEEAKNSYVSQWDEEKISLQLNKWLFLSSQDEDNSTVGVLLGTPIEGGVGTIIWVLVDKKAQNKRIGSQLFRKASDWYKNKGAHKLKLTVPEEKTVEFYTKQGMAVEGEHTNHWWNHKFWSMGLEI